jgi:putative hydrolase of the HAD superfamily
MDDLPTPKGAPFPLAPLNPLRQAETWLFDLDNTLYPASVDLFAQIDVRMRGYIAEYLGIPVEDAFVIQKQYFREYGTSLKGLMERHGMDPAPFLDHVHNVDLDVLIEMPQLDACLARLPGRKLIFTNASERHAERVLEKLRIGHHFDGIFDIVAADYRPKPEPETYVRLIDRHRIDPRASVMVEDIARNLEPAARLGMVTVWLRNASEIGRLGADGDYIHHIVDDLVEWLAEIVDGT